MRIGAAFFSGVYLAALAACIGLVAIRLSGRLASGLDRALVGGVVAASQGAGVPLAVSMMGLLGRWPVIAGHVLVAAGVEWSHRATKLGATKLGARKLGAGDRPGSDSAEPSSRAGRVAVTGVGAALVTLATLPTLSGRLPDGTDTRGYHIANLAAWVRERTLWTMPFQNPGFFTATHPGNGELLGATFVLATGEDHLLYLVNIGFAALAVLAVASLGRALGGRADLTALGGLAVMAAPIVHITHANSLLTDVAAASGLLAGLALLVVAGRKAPTAMLVVAGFALGLGLGSKYTVLILSAGVLVWAAVRLGRRVAWLAPGLGLLAAPWFVRNLVFTGNPIYPQGVTLAGIEVLPGGQSPLLMLDTSVFDHLVAGRWEVLERWLRLGAELYGPVAALAGLGVVVALLEARRNGRLRSAGLAAFVVFAALVYLITPWTGGGPQGLDFLMGSNLRYAIPATLVGIAVASAVLPARVFLAGLAAAFVYNAWRIARGAGFRADLDLTASHIAVVGVIAFLAVGAAALWRGGYRLRPVSMAGLWVLAAGSMVLVVAHVDRVRVPTALEATIDATGAREVIVLGADDIRSTLGARLDREIRTFSEEDVVSDAGPGDSRPSGRMAGRPVTDPDALTDLVRSSDADVLVVREPAVAVPEGWSPPADEWIRSGSVGQDDMYVRRPAPGPFDTPAPDLP